MADFRGVLAGCGFFAQFQMEAWNRLAPAGKIVAVCDPDEAKARKFATRFGVPKVYSGLNRMLDEEKPDFLDIVTRPEQHLPMAREAARRGTHVFCQKPFAPSIAEARRIVEACAGVRLMVNENFRFQAWYREIKKLLAADAIGEPFSFRWVHRANDGFGEVPYASQPYFATYPRLLIYETLVHWLDTARFLFGEPERVRCETSRINPRIAGEDLAIVTLRFPGRLRGVIDGNRVSPLDEPSGDPSKAMGSLRIDGVGGTLWMTTSGEIEIEPRGGARRKRDWPIPQIGYRGDCCFGTQKHFLDRLASGEEFETNGADYLKTMALVDACYRSAAEA